ncbi:MAG: hypothetical protein RIT00_406 [Actinomycetota bacterium]
MWLCSAQSRKSSDVLLRTSSGNAPWRTNSAARRKRADESIYSFWQQNYKYLPRSVAYLPKPTELIEMLTKCGFADAQHQQLSGGLTQLIVATRN